MDSKATQVNESVEQEFLSVIREYERVIYKVCYLYTTPNATLNDLYQDVASQIPWLQRSCIPRCGNM